MELPWWRCQEPREELFRQNGQWEQWHGGEKAGDSVWPKCRALSSEWKLQRTVTVRSKSVPYSITKMRGLHQRTLGGRVALETICAFWKKSLLHGDRTHWNNSRKGFYFKGFYGDPGTQKITET